MAAAAQAALTVSLNASLSIDGGNVESRSLSSQASACPLTKHVRNSQWPAISRSTMVTGSNRSRVVTSAASANDVAVTAPVTAETVGAPHTDVPAPASEPSKPKSQIQETSVFISDVANLIKLVDSRDIVELELKHKKYEIVIRKKEALKRDPPQSLPGPHVMGHTPWPQFAPAPPPPPTAAAPAPPPAAVEESAASAAPPAPAAPTAPAFLSPMAGTFYRSPAPGEPSFVKVGDRVQKGQVVCIIEAMKLMNEIEADQTGVLTDILAKDGNAVSIDTPLFVITP